METLTSSAPAPEAFAAFRRPASARYVGGVKARIMAKGAAPPAGAFADENEEPGDEGAPPSPRLFAKAPPRPRWEHPRPNSINEDELPKPDTVKHVKKIFESPGAAAPEKPAGPPSRFRKNSGSTPAVGIACGDGSAIARPPQEPPGPEANPSAKEPERASVNTTNCSPSTDIPPAQTSEDESPLPEEPPRTDFHPEISRDPALGAGLSAADDSADDDPASSPSEEEEHPGTPPEEPGPIAREPFPLEGRASPPSPLSQAAASGAEPPQDAALPPAAASPEEEMVVASGVSAGPPPPRRGGAAWQKPPAQATSVVFDFRGKDVKPHIQLQPAPFGCRPARAPPSKQPRGAVNGEAAPLPVPRDYEREEEEEWDEMDVGADLPPVSGIVFSGENVKVGRGAFLERRNKKLTIQFDDCATSTFEYPSENSSPSPMDENDSECDSTSSIGSAANCRVGLSNYTPQVLGSDNDFQLGVSQPNHRPNLPSPKSQVSEDVPALNVIPANPEDTGGWSATETVDILF